MRRSTATAIVLLCTAALSTACGDDATSDAPVESIDIDFSGDTVSPTGERVEVEVGQPVDLVVKSDDAGEIHVHSSPEKDYPFATGTTTIKLQIDRPGIVEVESHELDTVIVELLVR